MINTVSMELNVSSWDLMLDEKGNIATIKNQSAIAQNVACAVSTFLGESIANEFIGVDYQSLDDGRRVQYLSYLYSKEAKRLEFVNEAKAILQVNKNRELTGMIAVTDIDHNEVTLKF